MIYNFRERTYAIQKYSGHQSRQAVIFIAVAFVQLVVHAIYATSEIEFRADDPTDGQAEDEQHGKFTLRHVGQ